jgi:hypothetical protein
MCAVVNKRLPSEVYSFFTENHSVWLTWKGVSFVYTHVAKIISLNVANLRNFWLLIKLIFIFTYSYFKNIRIVTYIRLKQLLNESILIDSYN